MKSTRTWSWLIPLAFLSVTTFAIVSAGIKHVQQQAALVGRFSGADRSAMERLKDELIRRFSQTDNVDFGMARVIEPGKRMHRGPLMSRRPGLPDRRMVRVTQKQNTMPHMVAENMNESEAIDALLRSGTEVAIYTVGRFEFRNVAGEYRLRTNGPAYLDPNARKAPDANQIVSFAQDAWDSGKEMVEGPDGWILFAHKVGAPNMTCANCHGDTKHLVGKEMKITPGAVRKPGDSVGLLVIAMRKEPRA